MVLERRVLGVADHMIDSANGHREMGSAKRGPGLVVRETLPAQRRSDSQRHFLKKTHRPSSVSSGLITGLEIGGGNVRLNTMSDQTNIPRVLCCNWRRVSVLGIVVAVWLGLLSGAVRVGVAQTLGAESTPKPAPENQVDSTAGNQISDEDRVFFETDVRPILVNRCYECHSRDAESIESELELDSRDGWQRGGSRGATIVVGDPSASLLIQSLSYEDPELQMPPDRKLPDREVSILRDWIKRGAPDPRRASEKTRAEGAKDAFDIQHRVAEHWAWRPVERPPVPDVADTGWVIDPVDAFILQGHEQVGLKAAPDADALTWRRRVSFDLTGLPPTRSELETFASAPSAADYERVVDELLGRQSFGETWGQHWLDLVRYAETKGHEGDYEIPNAWRYRDYVINALNQNVPYNQFVTEHIAGDLIHPPRLDPKTRTNQSVQGTGFWFLGEATHSPVDIRGEEVDRVANQIDVFGKAFLGMTIACARCHDHKFDAISTADYYALCGVLQSSGFQQANVADPHAITHAQDQLDELNQASSDPLWQAYKSQIKERLRTFDQQLISAVELARKLADAVAEDGPQSARDKTDEKHASEKAAASDIAVSSQERLARQLVVALNDIRHPLHVFAIAALGDGDVPATISQVLERFSENSKRQKRRLSEQSVVATHREGELDRIPKRVPFDFSRHVVADFSQPIDHPDAWITGGHSFGSGPVARGQRILAADADQPIRLVAPAPAATNLASSNALTGLFRTKTFEIVGDKLWYRFRGKAKVFIAVDSHRTVTGPLHGIVQREIDSEGKIAWFAHRVDDYLGHRVHVEFQPTGEFMLFEVRFGAEEPPTQWQPLARLTGQLSQHPPETLDTIASMTASLLRQAPDRLEDAEHTATDTVHWVNWLLANDAAIDRSADTRAAGQTQFDRLAKAYVLERERIEASIPKPIWATAMLDGSGEDERVHLRGSHRRLAEAKTPRGTLTALGGAFDCQHGSGRMELARNTVDPGNPLTARVQVNRIWQRLLGVGLVPSSDNFGELGAEPTHPELLDYLADEFVSHGWDVKGLIRRLVLSRTYRMSSQTNQESVAVDPTNERLHAARVRRLTGEQIRDALLATSSQLDATRFGPSVHIHITDFMRHNRSPGRSGPMNGDNRRSIYLEVRRNAPSHFLAAFDKPVPFTTVGRRATSNSPAQPLILLNDPLVHEKARQWAARLVKEFDNDREATHDAYWTAFGRPPTPGERRQIEAYVACDVTDGSSIAARRTEAWTEVCLTLFNVKEFIFLR